MSEFKYICPKRLVKSVFGGNKPIENYRVITLLMLLGQGNILNVKNNRIHSLRNNYMDIPYQVSSYKSISEIVSLFAGISKKQLASFFKDNYSKNIAFHRNINKEILAALGNYEIDNNVSCFLYIYRIIEQISLCLPMVTLIKKTSFQFTFNDYKLLIDSSAKSDLSVLRKYSENILDNNIGNVAIEFDFSNCQNPTQNVNLIIDMIPKKARQEVVVNSTTSSISIKNKYIHILIVSFRNEYFHYFFHERNINFERLEYPDEFLSICNPIFQNYIGMLYYDLLNSELYIWG